SSPIHGTAGLPLPRVPAGLGSVGTAAVPAVAPDSAYQVRLALAARHETTVSIFAPPDYAFAEARDRSGRVITPAQVDHADGVPVAVLSDSPVPAGQLAEVAYGDSGLTVFSFDRPRSFPADAALLAGYVTIVLDQFDTGSLTRQQVEALRDFVGLGGNLVVGARPSWRRTVLTLPATLLPLVPS